MCVVVSLIWSVSVCDVAICVVVIYYVVHGVVVTIGGVLGGYTVGVCVGTCDRVIAIVFTGGEHCGCC